LFVNFLDTVLLQAVAHASASACDGLIAMLIAGYFGRCRTFKQHIKTSGFQPFESACTRRARARRGRSACISGSNLCGLCSLETALKPVRVAGVLPVPG
jgi:hypothetical protein